MAKMARLACPVGLANPACLVCLGPLVCKAHPAPLERTVCSACA